MKYQGCHHPGKSWKVLEFKKCPGKSWNVLEFPDFPIGFLEKSWNFIWNSVKFFIKGYFLFHWLLKTCRCFTWHYFHDFHNFEHFSVKKVKNSLNSLNFIKQLSYFSYIVWFLLGIEYNSVSYRVLTILTN